MTKYLLLGIAIFMMMSQGLPRVSSTVTGTKSASAGPNNGLVGQRREFLNLASPPPNAGLARAVADGTPLTPVDLFANRDGDGLQSDQNGGGVNRTGGTPTDNGPIITAAIKWGCENGYQDFYLPAGNYRVGDPAQNGFTASNIFIQSKFCDTVRLYGDGDATQLLVNYSTGGVLIGVRWEDAVGGDLPPGANTNHASDVAMVTAISAATPPVVTTDESSRLANEDRVKIRNCSGITGLNDREFIVRGVSGNNFSLYTLGGEAVVNAGGELGTWDEVGGVQCLIFGLQPDFHLTVDHLSMRDDAPYAHMTWTNGTFMAVSSEESHGIKASMHGGSITIHNVTCNDLGDECYDLSVSEAKVLVHNNKVNSGNGVTVLSGSGVTIRDNTFRLGYTLWSDELVGVNDTVKAVGKGTGAISLENHDFILENVEIHGNTIEGYYRIGINLSNNDAEDGQGSGIRGVKIYRNSFRSFLEPAWCGDEANEHCEAIFFSQQNGGRIEDISITENELFGTIVLQSNSTDPSPAPAGFIGRVQIVKNKIIDKGQGTSDFGIKVVGIDVLIEDNHIEGFDQHAIAVQAQEVFGKDVDDTEFSTIVQDADPEDPGSSYVTVVGHPYFLGDGNVNLSSTGSLPSGLSGSSRWLRVIGDNISFASTKEAALNVESSITFTDTDVTNATNIITKSGTGYENGDGPFKFVEGGSPGDLPNGITEGDPYWIRMSGNDITFYPSKVEAEKGLNQVTFSDDGAAVTHRFGPWGIDQIESAGSGTHTIDLNHYSISVDIIDNRIIHAGGSSTHYAIAVVNATTVKPHRTDIDYVNIIDNNISMIGSATIAIVTPASRVTHIEDNDIIFSGVAVGRGIATSNDNIFLIGNYIRTNGDSGITVGNNTIIGFNALIADNDIDAEGGSYGMQITNRLNMTLRGNKIQGSVTEGLHVRFREPLGKATGIAISDNRFFRAKGIHIECQSLCLNDSGKAKGFVVSNNIFDFDNFVNGTHAIQIRQVEDVVISGNLCIGLFGPTSGSRCVQTSTGADYIAVQGNVATGGVFGAAATNQPGTDGTEGAKPGCTTSGNGGNSTCDGNIVH